MKIAKLLRERRVTLRITQEDLAIITGLSTRTIGDIEQGKGNPSLSSIEKVASALGVELTIVVKQTIE